MTKMHVCFPIFFFVFQFFIVNYYTVLLTMTHCFSQYLRNSCNFLIYAYLSSMFVFLFYIFYFLTKEVQYTVTTTQIPFEEHIYLLIFISICDVHIEFIDCRKRIMLRSITFMDVQKEVQSLYFLFVLLLNCQFVWDFKDTMDLVFMISFKFDF